MLVSKQHRFIFLSNPKCASTTIRGLLHNRCEISVRSIINHAMEKKDPGSFLLQNATNLLHISACQLRNSFNRSKSKGPQAEEESLLSWEDYYSFGTVRNPFKKMVSWYFFLQPDKDFNTILDVASEAGYDVNTAYRHHFNDFIDHLSDNMQKGLPNHDHFFTDWDTGEVLVDDIFRVEELNETFPPKFHEATGIEIPSPLPNIMPDFEREEQTRYVKFKGDPYELYNDSSKQFIEEHFISDIEKFNYSFGE